MFHKRPPSTSEQKAAKKRKKKSAQIPEVKEKRLKAKRLYSLQKAKIPQQRVTKKMPCRQQMPNYPQSENERGTQGCLENNSEGMAQILLVIEDDQEDSLDSRHTNDAQNFADIVTVETDEEQLHQLQYLAQNRSNKVIKTHQAARKLLNNEDLVLGYHCGKMDEIYKYCGVRHFKGEKASDQKFRLCCLKGKIIVPPPKDCPEFLYHLFTNSHPRLPHFVKMVRNYNNALAFPSMGAQIYSPPGRSPYCFRIHGQMYHDTTASRYQNENIRPMQIGMIIHKDRRTKDERRYNCPTDEKNSHSLQKN
ncbi:hypothetical protein GHT06_014492 [Daphnia sinensis]|uniref:Uncharacterized protein n=1 Tax=Daphnia sinensis TaxID=1820382 RepID=A0AAD5KVQ9_9CRUS|nr:hypothetical protein GHT06_014492 [Daphnia sinensis]